MERARRLLEVRLDRDRLAGEDREVPPAREAILSAHGFELEESAFGHLRLEDTHAPFQSGGRQAGRPRQRSRAPEADRPEVARVADADDGLWHGARWMLKGPGG